MLSGLVKSARENFRRPRTPGPGHSIIDRDKVDKVDLV